MKSLLLFALLAVSGFAAAGDDRYFQNGSTFITTAPQIRSSISFNAGGGQILKIDADGTTTWHGHIVESDDEFKTAMISISEFLNGRYHCK